MIMFRWTQTGPSKTDIWTCVCHIHDRWKEHHVETGNHGFFQHHGNIDTPQKVQSKTDVILPTASTASLFGTSFAHTCPVIGVPCGHLEWSVRMPWCTCGREGASFVSNWSKIDLMLLMEEIRDFFHQPSVWYWAVGWIVGFSSVTITLLVNLFGFHGAVPSQLRGSRVQWYAYASRCHWLDFFSKYHRQKKNRLIMPMLLRIK